MSNSKRKKIFIHIGMFKTGSTSIQYFMNSNMYHLYEMDYYFPSTGRHPRAFVQHTLISDAFSIVSSAVGDFSLGSTINPDLIIGMLLHEIVLSRRSNIVLSSESFCILKQDAVSRIKERFADFDIQPIVYIRNLVDLADASYQTQIMSNASTTPFDVSGFNSWPTALDIAGMCEMWAAISADGKIVVRDYDRLKGTNLVLDFCKVLGIDAGKMDKTYLNAKLNVSVSMETVLIKQRLRSGGEPLDAVDRFIHEILPQFSGSRRSLVPYVLQKQMHDSYSRQLKTLSDASYVSGLEAFKEPSFVEKSYVGNTDGEINALIEKYRSGSNRARAN